MQESMPRLRTPAQSFEEYFRIKNLDYPQVAVVHPWRLVQQNLQFHEASTPATMILSGEEIRRVLNTQIFIEPYEEKLLNPNSYNLRLHDELMVYDEEVLDMKRPHKTKVLRIPEEGIVLQPGTLYLGRTIEHTRTEGYVPMLEGRSSIGRLGLFVHVTAGFGDVGFSGFWTLEISAIQPIRVYAGVQICQIFYHQIAGDYKNYVGGKYQNNTGIQASRLYKDFES